MTWRKHLTFALSLGLALGGGCIRPAEERADRDLDVGKASGHGLDVDVDSGLAAVRELGADTLRLWSSAPAWEMSVTTRAGAAKDWSISLENVIADATLRAVAGDTSLTVTQIESPLPTRKTYRVTLPAGTKTRFTLAPPDRNDTSPWRFALMSDVQEAIVDVNDIYRRMNEVHGLRFLLGAGDLTQQGQEDELSRFRDELAALDIPYYTTLGNHELGDSGPAYQDWYGRANSHFVYRGVHFSLLDSASATIDPIVYDWLDGWLASGRDHVHIVAMHIPPIDPVGVRNGSFSSRNEAAKLLTRLAEGRVDLTLYGHIHSYYSFDNAGIPAYISGGGGAIPERFDQIGRHFLVIDVDPKSGVKSVETVRVD
ncbi:MAG: metallophosphoesterase [Polyangiaceae bacterium]